MASEPGVVNKNSPGLEGYFYFKFSEENYLETSSFTFSIYLAAASRPPRPKDKPRAKERAAIIPINRGWMKAFKISNCDKAAMNAKIQIAHFEISPRTTGDEIPAAFAELTTNFFTASAITTEIKRISAATITLDK